MILVKTPGLLATVQDLGRPGNYAQGLPPSGALDRYSHSVANILLGNGADAATIEFTFVGPTLEFTTTARVAITGATIDCFLDGEPLEQWVAHQVRAGQVLTFGPMRDGARGYVAISGGIATPPELGSRSTYLPSRIGGVQGRCLAAGDLLPIEAGEGRSVAVGVPVPQHLRLNPAPVTELRATSGLCDYRLTEESRKRLFGQPYLVSHEADRTGYRLSGEPLDFVAREQPFGAGSDPSNVVSLGYPLGSLQTPNGSELICVLRDAVTGGGYVTLATVVTADLDVLAQRKAPDQVVFREVGLDVAMAARTERRDRIAELSAFINH